MLRPVMEKNENNNCTKISIWKQDYNYERLTARLKKKPLLGSFNLTITSNFKACLFPKSVASV